MSEPEFVAPTMLNHVLDVVGAGDALIVSGGTSVAVLLKQRLIEPEKLVWLCRVAELKGIRRDADGSWRVGACTTLAEVAASPELRQDAPMVAQAASVVANPRIRNVATVGGALAHADPRQDLPPALLAAGAIVGVRGPEGERSVPLRDGFFRGLMETALEPGEVVTHVSVPPRRDAVEAYRRFTPQSMDDYPTVAVAARLQRTGAGAAARLSLALGGVAPTPVLVNTDVANAAAAARAATSPTSDERGSAAYKTAMAGIWTQRVLSELLEGET